MYFDFGLAKNIMRKVVIFEDNERVLRPYREFADDLYDVEFIFCTDITDATPEFLEEHFRNGQLPVVVVMDACLPGDKPTTSSLVRAIRRLGYKGPMFAGSSESDYNEILLRAGCDRKLDSKEEGLQRVREILDQQ